MSWPILAYVCARYTLDTNYNKEEDVVVPIHVAKEMGLYKDYAQGSIRPVSP